MIVSSLRPADIYRLTDMALVSGSSLLFSSSMDKAFSTIRFDPEKEYYHDELAARIKRTDPGDLTKFEFARTPDVVAHIKKDTVPINLVSADNYYHLLIEWLPTLAYIIEQKQIGPDSVVVVGPMYNNMMTALRYVLYGATSSIFQLQFMKAVTCDTVIAAPPSANTTHLISGSISDTWYNQENIMLLRKKFSPIFSDVGSAKRKLYVRRVSSLRMMTNNAELERLAVEAGYQIVQPEGLSFFDQVKVFSSASHIMGPTGAWAANLLFVPEDAKVNVIYSDLVRQEKSLWGMLGKCFGLQVNDVYGPVSKFNPEHPIHSDFLAPLDVCRDLLRQ